MFELYRMGSFSKRWKKLGEFRSFCEAYDFLNEVMSGFPHKSNQTFRITGIKTNWN